MRDDLKNFHEEQQDAFALLTPEEAGRILMALVGVLVVLDMIGALGG